MSLGVDRPNIPAGWIWCQIQDVGEAILGKSKTGRGHPGAEVFPYLRVANVQEDRIDLSELTQMHFSETERDRYRLQQFDILLCEGQSPELVGRPAIYRGELPELYFQNHLIRFRCGSFVEPEFALLVFRAYMHDGIFAATATSTTNLASLGLRRFRQIAFPLPPVDVQREIAEISRSSQNEIDYLRQRIDVTRQLADRAERAVLMDLVNGEMAFAVTDAVLEGQQQIELGEQLLARIRKSPTVGSEQTSSSYGDPEVDHGFPGVGRMSLGVDRPNIPAGWIWCQIQDVGEAILGKSKTGRGHPGAEVFPYLRVANVQEDRIDLSELTQMHFSETERDRYRLQQFDILLCEGQSPELVGRPAIYRGELPELYFQNHLIRFRCGSFVEPEFALLVFRAYMHDGIFAATATSTTNLASLGLRRFRQIAFPLPPVDVQREIAEISRSSQNEIDYLRQRIDVTRQLADRAERAVLMDLVNGEMAFAVTDAVLEGQQQIELGEQLLARIRKSPTVGSEQTSRPKGRAIRKATVTSTPNRRRRSSEQSDRQPIVDVVQDAQTDLTPLEVFERTGIAVDSIDEFFDELRLAVADHLVVVSRPDESAVYIRALR